MHTPAAESAADTRRYRIALIVLGLGLVLSGLTAFPLLYEVELLARLPGSPASA